MDIKNYLNLMEKEKEIFYSARAVDNVLILDSQSLSILKANGITVEDMINFLDIKNDNIHRGSIFYRYASHQSILEPNNKNLDAIEKIVSISKNDLAFIIAKIAMFKKIFNIASECYFNNLLMAIENSIDDYSKERVTIKGTNKVEEENVDNGVMDRLNKIKNNLQQILNMSIVQANNFSFEINGPFIDLGDLCSNIGNCQTVKDDNILIAFAESGSLVICKNDILEEVVAGNSELAIKLYEDLLVGYKNNKKAAVYHSQLFTKYIIS